METVNKLLADIQWKTVAAAVVIVLLVLVVLGRR